MPPWNILHDPRTKLMAATIHKTTSKYLHSPFHLCFEYQLSLWNKVRWPEIKGKHNRLFCTNLIWKTRVKVRILVQGWKNDPIGSNASWSWCLIMVIQNWSFMIMVIPSCANVWCWCILWVFVMVVFHRKSLTLHTHANPQNLEPLPRTHAYCCYIWFQTYCPSPMRAESPSFLKPLPDISYQPSIYFFSQRYELPLVWNLPIIQNTNPIFIGPWQPSHVRRTSSLSKFIVSSTRKKSIFEYF